MKIKSNSCFVFLINDILKRKIIIFWSKKDKLAINFITKLLHVKCFITKFTGKLQLNLLKSL